MKPKTARILLVAGIVLFAGLCGAYGMLGPAGPSRKVMVQIPKGSSAGRIADILAGRGVVRSAFGFELLARLSGKSPRLRSGAYELNPAHGPMAALGKMVRGEAVARWVTFPEGFTARQIGERLEAARIGKADRFILLARKAGRSFSTAFPHPGDDVEGYLFPDTYLVPVGASEQTVIQLMLDSFGRKVADPLAGDLAESGMALRECVILASMIEREAKLPRDRALISAVLRSRLARDMPLECDATVLYALGRHKNRVLYRDLTVDSPYNTYLHPGLPPGPIANPGLASLKAALNPADVDYLYYVAMPDGSHIFSRTLAEHERATQTARSKRANKTP